MKKQLRLILLFVLAVFFIQAAHGAKKFSHPGTLHSQANLDFVKKQITDKKEPWITEFNRLKKSPLLNRKAHILTTVNSKSDQESANMRDDATAAYLLALMWKITDKDVYAKRAIAILNVWSNFQGFTSESDQDKLQAG